MTRKERKWINPQINDPTASTSGMSALAAG